MAELNPPGFLQNRTDHSARIMRNAISVFVESEGIVTDTDWLVSQRAAGAAMSVDIAVGQAYILGTEAANQGFYYCLSEAVVNKTIAAAHATLGRIDIVIARVYDAFYSGASSLWTFEVVTGTPHASPSAPALPDNSLLLATVAVDAAVTTIVDADITDGRTVMVPRGGGDIPWAVVTGGTTTTYSDSGTDYEIHSFLSTSSLDVLTAGKVDTLLVGGGGGGHSAGAGANGCGGGGGGGVRQITGLYLVPGSYAITVGAGGAAGTSPAQGGASSIGTIVSVPGGGHGGGNGANRGGDGASGGGGSRTYPGGAAIAGYGYAGGSCNDAAPGYCGGGGGGAGAIGGTGNGTDAGDGGDGVANSLRTNSAVYYGGGGGGGTYLGGTTAGTGGNGGGGAGSVGATAATSGTANTGGGGGSSGASGGSGGTGGSGGSGFVIVRVRTN